MSVLMVVESPIGERAGRRRDDEMSVAGAACNLETYAEVVNVKVIRRAVNFLLDFDSGRVLRRARRDQF